MGCCIKAPSWRNFNSTLGFVLHVWQGPATCKITEGCRMWLHFVIYRNPLASVISGNAK